MAESIHDQITRERKTTQPYAADVQIYRRYVRGEQDATLTPEMKTLLGSASKYPYADNVADMVIAAWSSRLTLTGFDVDDAGVATFLDGLFTRNQLGDLSYDVNYATGRDGNHAVMLRWLPAQTPVEFLRPEIEAPEAQPVTPSGRVTIHAEDWWDGNVGVWVSYDTNGQPAYAVKDFLQPIEQPDGRVVSRKRRTIYFADHIERYIEEGRGWAPYALPTDPTDSNGVVPWVKRDGSPLHIPVIPFSFSRWGQRLYGASELAGGLLANQDHLNDIQQDTTAAARLLGFQILWSTGIGWANPPSLQPGTFLYGEDAGARFGNIPAGDLTQLIAAHTLKLQTIARMTATPIHIITGGDWPSGIALVQAEKPLIAKVDRLAKTIGPAWATVAHRATEMANAFGGEQLSEDALVTAVFANPEQLDQLAQAQLALTQAQWMTLAASLPEWALREIGVDQEAIDAEMAQRQQRQAALDTAITGIAAATGPSGPSGPSGPTGVSGA